VSEQAISEATIVREIHAANEALEGKITPWLRALESKVDSATQTNGQITSTLVGLQAEIKAERDRCAREVQRLDQELARHAQRADKHDDESSRWRRWMVGSGLAGGSVAAGLAKILGLGGGPHNG